MNRVHKMLSAIAFALLTMMLTAAGALAHAAEDPSLAHRVLDSAAVPTLGLTVIGAVTVVWWWKNDKRRKPR